jgi:hypothetical protein
VFNYFYYKNLYPPKKWEKVLKNIEKKVSEKKISFNTYTETEPWFLLPKPGLGYTLQCSGP